MVKISRLYDYYFVSYIRNKTNFKFVKIRSAVKLLFLSHFMVDFSTTKITVAKIMK